MDRFSQSTAALNALEDTSGGSSTSTSLFCNTSTGTTNNAFGQTAPSFDYSNIAQQPSTSAAPPPALPNGQLTDNQPQAGQQTGSTGYFIPPCIMAALSHDYRTDSCHDCRRDHQMDDQISCPCTCHKEELELARVISNQQPTTSASHSWTRSASVERSTERESRDTGYPDGQTPAHPPFPCLLSPENRERFISDWNRPLWPNCLMLPVEMLFNTRPISPPARRRQRTPPDSPNGPGSLLDITGDVRYAIL